MSLDSDKVGTYEYPTPRGLSPPGHPLWQEPNPLPFYRAQGHKVAEPMSHSREGEASIPSKLQA